MIKHEIHLDQFIAKGQVTCELKDNMLSMTTHSSLPTERFDSEHLSINSYIYLPEKYKLPLRIDITARIDAPGFYILLGKGHINFATMWSDNRRLDDIIDPIRKTMFYHNYMKMNEFTNISLLYDRKEMQILINGEERYYSTKERYMKSRSFEEVNQEGFEFKIACDKLAELWIKSVSITEYEDTCGIIHMTDELPTPIMTNVPLANEEKPTFDKCISQLPDEIQSEIIRIDGYLKSLKKLKFKRQIEKNGNKISYVASDYGFSYAIYLSNDIFGHSLQWYLITNGKPDTWHKKADGMEDILNRLDHTAPEFAARMFYNLEDCVGCYQNCLARTSYHFKDKHKTVCHGKLKFKMSLQGFADACTFIDEIHQYVIENERICDV